MAINQKGIYRALDANFNRVKEGLRVCEDVCRFVLNRKTETKKYKDIRHDLTELLCSLNQDQLIKSRDIEQDVGKASTLPEMKRKEIKDIFYANSQRVKESIRVLEEFSKLMDKDIANKLKAMRYKIYAIEKKITLEF